MSRQDDAELTAHLMNLEQQLLNPEFRKNTAAVSTLIARDFREFGASGRVWSREAILELLAAESPIAVSMLPGFELTRLGPDAVLVTYSTLRPKAAPEAQDQIALRSSIWVQTDAGWQMLFHQGTKVSTGAL